MAARERRPDTSGRELASSIAGIVALGAALGLASNYLALASGPRHGLSWIQSETQIVSLESFAPVTPLPVTPAPAPTPAPRAPHPTVHHPIAATPAPTVAEPPPARAVALPVVPDTREPLEVKYTTTRRLWDAGAALLVDARSAEEYAEGHIAGAINLPFDDVLRNPDLVHALDTRGRAVVITYCGGGTCDLSKNLADVLIAAGQRKVLVFTGGLPGWQAEGGPVATGTNPGSAP